MSLSLCNFLLVYLLIMSHSHHHHASGSNLKLAFFLNLGFTIIEIVGGFLTNSVAIISDALHDFGDSLSLGLSWYLQKKSTQKSDETYTFGYRRFSLLGALINSIVLIIGSTFIIVEAVKRIMEPEATDAKGMIALAVLGVIVNGYAAFKVGKGKSLNERVVSWHLIEDVLGWLAILVAAIVMLFFDVPVLDPLLSIGITLFILWNVVKRLKETLSVFLQAKPTEIDLKKIESNIRKIKGIENTHHAHIWSEDGEHHVFTIHLKLKKLENISDVYRIKKEVKAVLAEYAFSHYTIETELNEEDCGLN